MKNITLSAEETQIEKGRRVARERHTTLNQMFRDWLGSLDAEEERVGRYLAFMEKAGGEIEIGGRKFTRDEMNER